MLIVLHTNANEVEKALFYKLLKYISRDLIYTITAVIYILLQNVQRMSSRANYQKK